MTSLTERKCIIELVQASLVAGARLEESCKVIELSARCFQRWEKDAQRETPLGDKRPARIQTPKNALSLDERREIISVVNSNEFASMSPSQIVPRLADDGRYIGSESSIYRVLKAANQLTHRGKDRAKTVRTKPRAICATAPNQLYSWDITYLPTEIKGIYFYLYLFIDIFSRKVVGWQIYASESSELAAEVMKDICLREKIAPGQVVLHSDNGSPMKGASMLGTLQALGVMPSFSRPSVSDDNAYSEAWFRTLKYNALYPQNPFKSLLDARTWVGSFIHWYNHEHRHSAISFVTPNQRHDGTDADLLAKRRTVYEAARARNPERWSGATRNWEYVTEVYLNPDQKLVKQEPATEMKIAA